MNGHNSRRLTVRGIDVPAFIYGTAWKEERTSQLTGMALSEGFRAVDTANQRRHYFEAAVGEAVDAFVRDGGAPRSELFVQTKFTYASSQDHRLPYDTAAPPALQVAQSFEQSLEHLKTHHIDSFLLHGPAHGRGISREDWEVWQAMEGLHRNGKVALLGVSNVSVDQLAELLTDCSVAPAFVQNRCYARTGWDKEVRALCQASGIVYQGFSLLTANRQELKSPTLIRIAGDSGRTPAQVVFRFALQMGMIPLTGTCSATHMREDLACFDFELSKRDIEAIEQLSLR
jgi:diketogulonate reductase-like aldo/keto reductase